jgi:transcriptional regulator with XRE-family HTH domain
MKNQTFGEKIHALRKAQKKSQQTVAREIKSMCGVRMSQAMLSEYEQRAYTPRGSVLCSFASYFGVSSQSLMPDDYGYFIPLPFDNLVDYTE